MNAPEPQRRQFNYWPSVPFFYASLVILFFLTCHFYDPGHRAVEFTQPETFGGDEPHYLIIISSIIRNRGISLGPTYRSVRLGGPDAGRSREGLNLDHHTLIQDTRTGESRLWAKVFNMFTAAQCQPDDPSCVGYERIGPEFPDYTPANPEYRELPTHPIPFPGLLAGLLRAFGTRPDQVETRAIYCQVFLSWLAGIITYFCARGAGLTSGASVLVVAVLYYASPWLEYSHQLFPATFMGLLLIAALWAFLKRRFWVSAAFLAVATMQSEAFVFVFPAWTLLLYLLKEKRSALVFGSAGGAALLVTALISHLLLGKASARDMSFIVDPVLIWRTFVEPETGVWLFIPWSVAVFCFLILALFSRKRNRELVSSSPCSDLTSTPRSAMGVLDATRTLKVLAAGIFPVAAVYMILPYTGQFCYGPRYWVPYVPWLALGLIVGLKVYEGRKYYHWVRLTVITLAAFSVIIAITGAVLPPGEIWHQPPLHALTALFHS